jgi:hypothetical protein
MPKRRHRYPRRVSLQIERAPEPPMPSDRPDARRIDPAIVMRTCANCGSIMEERKCKLICHGCGYFLSCSDYY